MPVQAVANVRNMLGYLVSRHPRLLALMVNQPKLAQAFSAFADAAEQWRETRGVPPHRVDFNWRLLRDGAFLMRPFDTDLGYGGRRSHDPSPER